MEQHHGGPSPRFHALVGAGAAATMTLLWLVVAPAQADDVDGVRGVLVRWGHAASWAALTVLALLTAAGAPRPARQAAGGLAAVLYAAFLTALLG